MPDADVYQNDRLVGHFERTAGGIRLSFREGISLERGSLATTLPRQTIETPEIPPFFLNLLPEGARLRLLLESAKSKDDSLDLLVRVGWDTVGDVSVLPHGEAPGGRSVAARAANLADVDFWELFSSGCGDNADSAIAGVQEKISASTVAFGVRTAHVPSAILKLNPPKYPRLVHNEEFFLRMAKACGIEVNRAVLVHDKTGEPGLLVTRFDRIKEGRTVRKLHQEDACQLLDRPPGHKYHVSLRAIAERLMEVCTSSVVEVERLLRRVAFSYAIGNCDFHGKNISVLWDGVVRLSPGYDLLSTLPYASLDRHMALKLQGKDDNLRRGDFIDFGKPYGLSEKAVSSMLAQLCDRAEPWIGRFGEIGFGPKVTSLVQEEMRKRIGDLRR